MQQVGGSKKNVNIHDDIQLNEIELKNALKMAEYKMVENKRESERVDYTAM